MHNEHLAGHLPTRLKGLDAALCGGIPFGVITELVGPAGIGKTQVWHSDYIWFLKYFCYASVIFLISFGLQHCWEFYCLHPLFPFN